jgi:pantetheine-phosphate adenylyltransferase
MMTERHAVYPGTFDPPTLGHLDILARALRLFDRVTVAVARGGRSTLFSAERRAALFRTTLAGLPGAERCEVVVFDGLLVDFVRGLGAGAVVRGLRTPGDLEHEQPMAAVNRTLWPDYEVVLLFARPELGMVSGTLVRDVARCGGDVRPFVHPAVAAALAGEAAD